MNSNDKKFWFPAKRYGWGWGLPNCWQGWVVFIVWLVLLYGGTAIFWTRPARFGIYAPIISAPVLVIVVLKGEKPRWRWGNDQKK